MDKLAQKRLYDRGILNKIKEMTNISGHAAENFFKPDFDKVMAKLRIVDNNIRSIAAGETIGIEDFPGTKVKVPGAPGKYKVALKQLVKSAKSNLNRREYMQGVSELGKFHAKMAEIVDQIKDLDLQINEVPQKFMFDHLVNPPPNETPAQKKERLEYLEHLKEMRTRLAAERRAALVKEAGIMDFFVNIGTKRGRALAAWEKRYPKHTEKLKNDSAAQVEAAETQLNGLLASLKVMASARATRNVDAYMDEAEKIRLAYEPYDASFRKYYKENVKGFLEKMFADPPAPTTAPETPTGGSSNTPIGGALSPASPGESGLELAVNTRPGPSGTMAPEEQEGPPTVRDAVPAGAAPVLSVPDLVVPTPAPAAPAPVAPAPVPTAPTFTADLNLPVPSTPPTAPSSGTVAKTPRKKTVQKADDGFYTDAHKKFYQTLEALSGESPIILAGFISKYARSIQNSDPTTAIKLFGIAKSIKG